jgi:urea carboxylase
LWNRYRQTSDFTHGRQWLLRFFDQLRFYPVSADELLRMREDFVHGQFQLKVAATTLKLRDYREFLSTHADSIARFKERQQTAFEAERERWRDNGQLTFESEPPTTVERDVQLSMPAGTVAITSPVTGSVWTLAVQPGQRVKEGDDLLVLEAMKMEIPILADEAGEIVEVRCEPGKSVVAGDVLVIIKAECGVTTEKN